MLDAVRFVHKAWERITQKTIQNCFRHTGIIQEEVSTEIECSVATTEEDEDDLPLSECTRRIDSINFASCDLDGVSSVDGILTTETLTAEDIVTEVKNQQTSASDEKNLQEEEDSEEQQIEVNVQTINEALETITVVHNFYDASSENVQLICELERIERDLQMHCFATRMQIQITDFFNAFQ